MHVLWVLIAVSSVQVFKADPDADLVEPGVTRLALAETARRSCKECWRVIGFGGSSVSKQTERDSASSKFSIRRERESSGIEALALNVGNEDAK